MKTFNNKRGLNLNFKKIYAIDTNILLDNAQNLIKLSQNGDNLIVIPETVLDEIDMKKSGFDEINYQAREFGRLVAKEEIVRKFTEGNITIIETIIDDVIIYTIQKNVYQADKDNVQSSIKNDRKILEIIKEFRSSTLFKSTIFLSLDVMARKRAVSLDIPTESLNLGNDELDVEFIKYIETNAFPQDDDDILDINPNHTPDKFGYVFYNQELGFDKLSVIKNNKIEYIDESKLRKQDVNPINTDQLFFSNALLDDYYDIVIADAKAGSGKTLLGISAAMKMIRDRNNELNRIVYIRNSVESLQKGEDVGYLATNEAKFEIYNFPLFDTLSYIANKQLKHSNENKNGANKNEISENSISEKVQDLIEKYQIETMWVGGMRGRTLSNAYVIVDEAQNMSSATMQLILSRIDKTCKIVVLGSNRQIDNQYINKFNNGLSILLNATKEMHEEVNLFAIELKKVLRGPITAFAEKIFSKD